MLALAFTLLFLLALGYGIGALQKPRWPELSERELVRRLVTRVAARRMREMTEADIKARIDGLADDIAYEATHGKRQAKPGDDYAHPLD